MSESPKLPRLGRLPKLRGMKLPSRLAGAAGVNPPQEKEPWPYPNLPPDYIEQGRKLAEKWQRDAENEAYADWHLKNVGGGSAGFGEEFAKNPKTLEELERDYMKDRLPLASGAVETEDPLSYLVPVNAPRKIAELGVKKTGSTLLKFLADETAKNSEVKAGAAGAADLLKRAVAGTGGGAIRGARAYTKHAQTGLPGAVVEGWKNAEDRRKSLEGEDVDPLQSVVRGMSSVWNLMKGIPESAVHIGRGVVNIPAVLAGSDKAAARLEAAAEAASGLARWRGHAAGSLGEHINQLATDPASEGRLIAQDTPGYLAEVVAPLAPKVPLATKLRNSLKETSSTPMRIIKKAAISPAELLDRTVLPGAGNLTMLPLTAAPRAIGKGLRTISDKYPDSAVGRWVRRNVITGEEQEAAFDEVMKTEGDKARPRYTKEEVLSGIARGEADKMAQTANEAELKIIGNELRKRAAESRKTAERLEREATQANKRTQAVDDAILKAISDREKLVDFAAKAEARGAKFGEGIEKAYKKDAELGRDIEVAQQHIDEALRMRLLEQQRDEYYQMMTPQEQARHLEILNKHDAAQTKLEVLQKEMNRRMQEWDNYDEKLRQAQSSGDTQAVGNITSLKELKAQYDAATIDVENARRQVAEEARQAFNKYGEPKEPPRQEGPTVIDTDRIIGYLEDKLVKAGADGETMLKYLPVVGDGEILGGALHVTDTNGNFLKLDGKDLVNVLSFGPDGKPSKAGLQSLQETLSRVKVGDDVRVKVDIQPLSRDPKDVLNAAIASDFVSGNLSIIFEIMQRTGGADSKRLAEELLYINHMAGYTKAASERPLTVSPLKDVADTPLGKHRQAHRNSYMNVRHPETMVRTMADYRARLMAQLASVKAADQAFNLAAPYIAKQQEAARLLGAHQLPGEGETFATLESKVKVYEQRRDAAAKSVAMTEKAMKAEEQKVASAIAEQRASVDPTIIRLNEEIADIRKRVQPGWEKVVEQKMAERTKLVERLASLDAMQKDAAASAAKSMALAEQRDQLVRTLESSPAYKAAKMAHEEAVKASAEADAAWQELFTIAQKYGTKNAADMVRVRIDKLNEHGKRMMESRFGEDYYGKQSKNMYPRAVADMIENVWFARERLGWTGVTGDVFGSVGEFLEKKGIAKEGAGKKAEMAGRGVGMLFDVLQRAFVRNVLFGLPAELNPTQWRNAGNNIVRMGDFAVQYGLTGMPEMLLDTMVKIAETRDAPLVERNKKTGKVERINYSLAGSREKLVFEFADGTQRSFGELVDKLGGEHSFGAEIPATIEKGLGRFANGVRDYYNQNAASYGYGPLSDMSFKIAGLRALVENGMKFDDALKVVEQQYFAYHKLPAMWRKVSSSAFPFMNWTAAATIPLAEMYGRLLPIYSAAMEASYSAQQTIADSESFDLRKWRQEAPVADKSLMYLGDGEFTQAGAGYVGKTAATDIPYRLLTRPGARIDIPSTLAAGLSLTSPIPATAASVIGAFSPSGPARQDIRTRRTLFDEDDPGLLKIMKVLWETGNQYFLPSTAGRLGSHLMNMEDGKVEQKGGREYTIPHVIMNALGMPRFNYNLWRARNNARTRLPRFETRGEDNKSEIRDQMKRIQDTKLGH
jgi:hypothetical protein